MRSYERPSLAMIAEYNARYMMVALDHHTDESYAWVQGEAMFVKVRGWSAWFDRMNKMRRVAVYLVFAKRNGG